jgi:hypothetical protein
MAKQPEFNKYLPLEDWFRKQPPTTRQIELTLAGLCDQTEDLVDQCTTQDPEPSHSLA